MEIASFTALCACKRVRTNRTRRTLRLEDTLYPRAVGKPRCVPPRRRWTGTVATRICTRIGTHIAKPSNKARLVGHVGRHALYKVHSEGRAVQKLIRPDWGRVRCSATLLRPPLKSVASRVQVGVRVYQSTDLQAHCGKSCFRQIRCAHLRLLLL